jgi:putative component of membrane protein insertase Oxa1/YidC/SpoIIIJ protein YidD
MFAKYFIPFVFLCIVFSAKAQMHDNDMDIINTHIQNEQASENTNARKVRFHMTYNPIKLVLFIPLYLYQRFISEQASAVCEFEPSCSNFGLQSITQLGLIKGLFLTADRLTRCNGDAQLETKFYLINHHSGKVIDAPNMYKIRD